MAQQHSGPNPQPPHPPTKPQIDPGTEPQRETAAAVDGVNAGLVALDATIMSQMQISGPPGSGLFMLLDNLAVSTLGCTRTAYPTAPAPTGAPGTPGARSDPSNPNFGPGVPGTSPPGPLPGAGRGQAPNAASSQPLNQPG